MNKYQKLVYQIDAVLSGYVRDRDYVIRISDGEDFCKILKYGTDRANLSPKPWAPLSITDIGKDIKHEDVIIASTYNDLINDTSIEHGTLRHKLETIEYPLIVCYRQSDLNFLYEEPKTDLQNQGTHFTFKNEKTKSLILIMMVNLLDSDIEMFKLTPVPI